MGPIRIKKFFALAHPANTPKTAHALCQVVQRHDSGAIGFLVINGGWGGTLNVAQDKIHVPRTGDDIPTRIVWTADKLPYIDYNDSLDLINRKLAQ
jgi:hypothetical protein